MAETKDPFAGIPDESARYAGTPFETDFERGQRNGMAFLIERGHKAQEQYGEYVARRVLGDLLPGHTAERDAVMAAAGFVPAGDGQYERPVPDMYGGVYDNDPGDPETTGQHAQHTEYDRDCRACAHEAEQNDPPEYDAPEDPDISEAWLYE